MVIYRKEKCLQKLQMVTDVQNGVGVLMVIYRKEKCLQKLQMVTDVQNGVGVNGDIQKREMSSEVTDGD